MTITVSQDQRGTLQIIAGHMRLRALLDINGKVEVYNVTKSKKHYVHEVDGELFAVDEDGQAQLDSMTATAIANAARKQR